MIEVVDDEENMDEDLLIATKDPVKWACEAIERMFTANRCYKMFLEISNMPSDPNAFYIATIREGYGSVQDYADKGNIAGGICTKITDTKIADSSDALFILQQITEELKDRGRYEVKYLSTKKHVGDIIGANCYVEVGL